MSTPEPVQGTALGVRAVVWGLVSLAAAVVLGVLLTWGAKGLDRWGVLPLPQIPAWYDCTVGGHAFALQYVLGSDHLALQWPGGETLQADTEPDRMVWRNAAGLDTEKLAQLPAVIRYESASRMELRSANGQPVSCTRRAPAAVPSAP